ncbi:MAG TPA: glycosyltransferase [Candidatus Dojkabacteria bacterium]|nr:glycosyltransferase [Candidatus Dojkabacteria bacterium]
MISIVIPLYEKSARIIPLLSATLTRINLQTYRDSEIIIYDTTDAEDLTKQIENIKELKIRYIKNPILCNMATNLNLAFKEATREIIHINHIDTYFLYNSSLEKVLNNFDKRKGWLTSGYTHTRDGLGLFKPQVPKWNNEIYINNTIGTSSCLYFLKENCPSMDENLDIFADCEYYYQLFKQYGEPKILEDIIFGQLLWENPDKKDDTQEDINKEIQYIVNKYSIKKEEKN